MIVVPYSTLTFILSHQGRGDMRMILGPAVVGTTPCGCPSETAHGACGTGTGACPYIKRAGRVRGENRSALLRGDGVPDDFAFHQVHHEFRDVCGVIA